MAPEPKVEWMSRFAGLVRVARWATIIALFGMAVVFALEFILNSPIVNPLALGQFAKDVASATEPSVNWVKAVLKINMVHQGFDLAPLGLAIVLYMLMMVAKNQSIKLVAWLEAQGRMRQVQVARPRGQGADGLSFSSTSTDKEARGFLGRLGLKRTEERDKLLRELADVKKRLEETKQRLAFLSVDIVGSTRIKVGQDPLTSEHLFREYRLLLEGIFKKFRYRAASWTPDGVMACFPQVELAFGGAKDLLKKLPAFNKDRNHTGMVIQVRCGLNAGEVHYDESTPLELLSSRVLDVTGHLQKTAQPNAILVTEEIFQELREKGGLIPMKESVDGYKVYQWSTEAREADAQKQHVVS